jgi:membrane-associated phospholipid phosphatase
MTLPHSLTTSNDAPRTTAASTRTNRTFAGIGRQDLLWLVGSYVVLTGIFVLIGEVIMQIDRLVEADQSASERMADGRTPTMDTLSWWGSMLAETFVKIAVTAIIAGVMYAVWRRWREPLMVAVPLILEAAVFITVTFLVARPRPDVVRLDESPVDSSFPSGHTAAAAAYCAVVIVVFWHTRKTWIRALSVAVAVAIPVIVGWARAYRGMHHLSDVVAGAILGVICVFVVRWILGRNDVTPGSDDHADDHVIDAASSANGQTTANI